MAVDLGCGSPNVLDRGCHELANRADLRRGPGGRLLDALEHEQDPGLPGCVAGHAQKEAVVVGLVGDDESAQVEDWQREKLLLDEVQTVEHAPRAAVAVGEGMDRLKLVVGGRHADERVEVASTLFPMQKSLPVGEQTTDPVLPLWRRVNDLARGIVGQRRAGQPSHLHRSIFDPAADEFCGRGAERSGRQRGEAIQQGVAIPQCLLRGRVGRVTAPGEPKQPVGRGHDLLDFRTRLSFEQRQRVDEDRGVGEQGGCLLQFPEGRAGGDAAFQNRPGFQVDWRRERRQVIARHVGSPSWQARRVAETRFLRHAIRICRRRRHVQTMCRIFLILSTRRSSGVVRGPSRSN